MTCSTTDYVTEKRQKARRQLHNTLGILMTSPIVRQHIEGLNTRTAVFSWRETFDSAIGGNDVKQPDKGLVNEWLRICMELKHSVKGLFTDVSSILKT